MPRFYCGHVPHEPRPRRLAVVVAAAAERRVQAAAVAHPAFVAAEAGGEDDDDETDGVGAEVVQQQQQGRWRAGIGYGRPDGEGWVGGQEAGEPVQPSETGKHQLQGDDVSDVPDDDDGG